MNIQKANLGLTVELMNRREEKVSLNTFKNYMLRVKDAGKFLGAKLNEERTVANEWRNSDYTLSYENCSLDINLMTNMNSTDEMLRGFKFR